MSKAAGAKLRHRHKEVEQMPNQDNQEKIPGVEQGQPDTIQDPGQENEPSAVELSREEKRAYLNAALSSVERIRAAEAAVEQAKRDSSDACEALLKNVGSGPFSPEGSGIKYSVSRREKNFFLKKLDFSNVVEL